MDNKSAQTGVSVVVCCYNSISRLHPTLAALSKQIFNGNVLWEVIIVDNASNDNTGAVAIEIWGSLNKNNSIPFNVVYEYLPGLGNARKKGLAAATYNFVLFCDDDNWLATNYVEGVYNILTNDDWIAACGGKGLPVFETEKPFWFDEYSEAFAVGSQSINEEDGILLNLYGAGMAVNKNAIEYLAATNFKPQMFGRTGKKLSSSEDTELTYAFILMGCKLHYAPDLQFFHFLPKERLQFSYLKKLFIAFGTDGPIRNLYYAHISKRRSHQLIKYWHFHFLLSIIRLFKYIVKPPKKYGRVIYYNWNIAYITQLLTIRKRYKSITKNIQSLNTNLPKPATAEPAKNYSMQPY
jgi:glycosyltransferase involved in cell wall biosynthesis